MFIEKKVVSAGPQISLASSVEMPLALQPTRRAIASAIPLTVIPEEETAW